MPVTIPLGPRARLTIGRVGGCGGGWWAMRWRKRRRPGWEDEPLGAVDRAPLVPRLPTRGGAIALSPQSGDAPR
jgi:hypothetical protein